MNWLPPLCDSTVEGDAATVELLLRRGAVVLLRTVYSQAQRLRVHCASAGQRRRATLAIFQRPSCGSLIAVASGFIAGTAAVVEGDAAMVELLVRRGAAPDLRDADGRTALMYAACHGHVDCVTRLIRHAASVTVQDHHDCGRRHT